MFRKTIVPLLLLIIATFNALAQNGKSSPNVHSPYNAKGIQIEATTREQGKGVSSDEGFVFLNGNDGIKLEYSSQKDAACKVIEHNGLIQSIIVNSDGNMVGTYSVFDISEAHGLSDQKNLASVNMHRSIFNVKSPCSHVVSSDGKYLLIFGGVPEAHRGGTRAIQIISMDDNVISSIFTSTSGINSNPVLGIDGSAWLFAECGKNSIRNFTRNHAMYLLRVDINGELSSSVMVDTIALWSAALEISPDGQNFLMSGRPLGFNLSKTFWWSLRDNSSVKEIKGLLPSNTWLTNELVFSTNGKNWNVVDVVGERNVIETGAFDRQLPIHRSFALADGRLLLLYSFANSMEFERAIVFDWKTNAVEWYRLPCAISTSKEIETLQFGVTESNTVWIVNKDKLLILSQE
jgi:Tol biopolymer transport system component